MNSEIGVLREQPLSGSSKLALSCGAGATILLSYIVSIAFILILLTTVACEFVILLGLARFGLSRLIAGVMGTHINLLTVFLRSFWLRKGVEFRSPLQPSDAPALFEML